MAVLEVLQYPHPFLKTNAEPVDKFDNMLKKAVEDMIETMYNKIGVGLAATQVGIGKRLFVMDVNYNREDPESKKESVVVINPEIVEGNGEETREEGCLSVPEFRAEVKRHSEVTIQFFDLHEQPQQIEANGLLSICIQHELDHLNGKLFIDHLPPLKRKMIQTKLKKRSKREANPENAT